jgi:uncharacterized protein (TIGR00369 family)
MAIASRTSCYLRGTMPADPVVVPNPDEVNTFFAEQFPSAYADGHRCIEMGPGRCRVRWSYDPTTLRPGGFISGPTQFALADLALWFLTFTVLGLAPMAVTTDMHINFLRPAVGSDLFAEANLLRAGKSRIVGEVTVWVGDARDRPVAKVVGAYARLA